MRKHKKEEKLKQLKDELSEVLVILNREHSETILQAIDGDHHMNTTQIGCKKRDLIKTQYKIRKSMIGQKVHMYFTNGGKAYLYHSS